MGSAAGVRLEETGMAVERWRAAVEAGLKAFRMAWSSAGGGGTVRAGTVGGNWFGMPDVSRLLPGTLTDWERLAGDVTENGVVAICLGWIADNIVEPALRVERDEVPVKAHPLVRLLEQPNPYYDGDALWAATAASYAAHGNAYWLKVRDGGGRLSELWWVPFWQVSPCWPSDGGEFISHYVYRVNGQEIPLPREDVVHFRFGVEARNPRLGMSRLRAVLREIVTDNEASTFMAAVLKNMAIPSVLITPLGQSDSVGAAAAEAMQKQFLERYGGDGRGKPFIPSVAMKVERLSLSPEELVLDRVRQFPEARICGALRIPALVVGVNVGDQTRTYANYSQARKAAYEDCLMPLGRRLARAAGSALLPELGDPRRERVTWDYTEVAALRDDLTEVYKRNNLGIAGGWMTVNEARERAGLGAIAGGDGLRQR
jgi:HK97 family phage portal protein